MTGILGNIKKFFADKKKRLAFILSGSGVMVIAALVAVRVLLTALKAAPPAQTQTQERHGYQPTPMFGLQREMLGLRLFLRKGIIKRFGLIAQESSIARLS